MTERERIVKALEEALAETERITEIQRKQWPNTEAWDNTLAARLAMAETFKRAIEIAKAE
jgi:hypothetical protein